MKGIFERGHKAGCECGFCKNKGSFKAKQKSKDAEDLSAEKTDVETGEKPSHKMESTGQPTITVMQVARILHERRHRPNPIITTGELIGSIGSAGMQEALSRNWLIPDNDTGFLMVNCNAGKLAEIAEACRCKTCGKSDGKCECECAEKPSKKTLPKTVRESIYEAWTGPGVGTAQQTGGTPMVPRPASTSPTSAQDSTPPRVGDEVMVADDGKTYTGKVSTVGQDGRYRVSFGADKPKMDRDYGPNQMQKVKTATPHA